ncbi:AGAP013397-PA-like protein [Anopheles sinensis]|uniref:AGAP013397-PA-like protein n=1 Tax=Anopheles sinensis TaxID=74873 RepID=A0A084VN40_ANOSI|nr:AGAP013397-PA-like protein [Anopheles sinensis]
MCVFCSLQVTVLFVTVLLPLAAYAKPSTSLDPTDLADVDLLSEDVSRIKRSGLGSGSGSFDLLSGLKKTILSGIGSASASLVAGSSSSSLSSGSGHGSSGGSGGSSYGHSASSSSSGHSYDKPHVSTSRTHLVNCHQQHDSDSGQEATLTATHSK